MEKLVQLSLNLPAVVALVLWQQGPRGIRVLCVSTMELKPMFGCEYGPLWRGQVDNPSVLCLAAVSAASLVSTSLSPGELL